MKGISTLGLFINVGNTIENVDVKVKAMEDTEIEYSVYLSDEIDDKGNCLKIYSSSIRMYKTMDFTWMNLPVNLYLGEHRFHINLKKNPKLQVAQETFANSALHCV